MIVIRPVKPKLLDRFRLFSIMRSMMDEVAREIHEDFKKTVETWDRKPEFTVKRSVSVFGPKMVIEVSTDDLVYRWIAEGTRAHEIVADEYPVLVFRSEYASKTVPEEIGSWPSAEYGDLIITESVYHPGIEPRDFEQTIREKWEPILRFRLEHALRAGARRSGYGIEERR